jgi:hypothetical protein
MPASVKTERDEAAWDRAKRAAHRQYDFSEENDRFWRIVNSIYQNMKALEHEDPGAEPMTLIDQDDDAELHRTGRLRKALVGLILRPRRSQRPLYRVIRVRGV